MPFTRSDASCPGVSIHNTTNRPPLLQPPSSSTASSIISSPPHTPRRSSRLILPYDNDSPAFAVGLITPGSSRASLSPALPPHKDVSQLVSPAFSLNTGHRSRRGYSSATRRRPFFPTRPSLSLELHVQPAQFSTNMTTMTSRPGSPVRIPRPLSPRPEHIPRPPSRCESLLRDTLRRADEFERSRPRRDGSRSPGRKAAVGRSARPRGNSLLGALSKPEEAGASDYEGEDDMVCYSPRRESFNHFARAPPNGSSPRVVNGMSDGIAPEAMYYPYGSPSSPSPLPPSMLRTRTAPAIPRASHAPLHEDFAQRGLATRPQESPRAARHSLPNTATGGGGPSGSHSHSQSPTVSNDTSPKQRLHTLSPHEAVLRAKLNVLLKAGSTSPDEKTELHSHFAGRVRNHQRSQSHGVIFATSQKFQDEAASASVSPNSLTASSLSNSATDIAKLNSSTPAYRRNSSSPKAGASSPSSPSEPLTPPPTPPFNARTASELCKRMDGYVSFANVEGLGEPPGMDIDGDDVEENGKPWGRWWRMWSFSNGTNGAEHEHGHGHLVTRGRSDSSSSRR